MISATTAARPSARSTPPPPAEPPQLAATAPGHDEHGPTGWVSHALEHLAHYLPAQAPLEVFVHHNTLHAYQHLPFYEAITASFLRLGAHGFLREDQYRAAWASGRIDDADIEASLDRFLPTGLPEPPHGLPPLRLLARQALLHDIGPESRAGLRWLLTERRAGAKLVEGIDAEARGKLVAETRELLLEVGAGGSALERGLLDAAMQDALGRVVDRASLQKQIDRAPEPLVAAFLWQTCRLLGSKAPAAPAPSPPPRFPRDVVLACGGDDPTLLVEPVLIPLAAAFLDRGQTHWSMPDREHGFFVAFRRVLGAGHAVRPSWLASLGQRLRRYEQESVGAEQAIVELLGELGIGDDEREEFLEHTLLLMPGWAGMFHRLEATPGPVGRAAARASLVDFVAVRLCLDVLALADAGKRLGHRGPLAELRAFCRTLPQLSVDDGPGDHTTAWPLFLLAQHAAISPRTLLGLSADAVRDVLSLLTRFDRRAHLRVWHEAYERHYRQELLRALHHNRGTQAPPPPPRYQIVLCIDDRCESLRRHLEELEPRAATYGAAGFFNLAIAYQGIDDPSTFPLCPVVLTPQHRIEEEPIEGHAHLAEARRRRMRQMGAAQATFSRASRSLFLGPLVTAVAGLVAALPLLASVFAPWWAGTLRKKVQGWLLPTPKTRLTLPRFESAETGELMAGFSVEEKAARVGTLLENLGLVRGFSRIVAIIGHDSSSVNNPHVAAYSCGACGGRSGGPNARLFARMANRPEVRDLLRTRGIDIPPTTRFVGGVHDTCADRITLFDVDDIDEASREDLDGLTALLDRATRHNAHERCRKFASAPRDPAIDEALRHVEGRSFDLSQARPELGHATNASCVVGRRSLTRGLFLDRRAFLVSYDPSTDPEGAVLERILLAVGPVGAGINLEYYFSTTDFELYGAGTKLPHNVTGLFAVMNGASSDLRTGLPRQMVEIHEPVRLHLVVEASPDTLTRICQRQPAVRELVHNEWVRLCALDPLTGDISVFRPDRGFEPFVPDGPPLPVVARSSDWYRGRDGFVPPARIAPSEPSHVA